MCFTFLHGLVLHLVMYVLAFDDISVNGEASKEMLEQGRAQYQLLKERGSLPQYGNCWKLAVEHVNEGCKYLSEETQSDIALHLTNCFLEMSGHETYNCEFDKKANLRGICINSMTDRAFNVYTEFYTHTQNICWFLRGQIWHETISENTFKVSKQLEESASNQEELLNSQKQSLEMQKKILEYGNTLGEVLEELYTSTKSNKEILHFMTTNMISFHGWIVNQVSWYDSLIFYSIAIFVVLIATSIKRTEYSRLPMFLLLLINFLIERFIWALTISWNKSTMNNNNVLYEQVYEWIWYCRYLFIILNSSHLIYYAIYYKNLIIENHKFLTVISKQITEIASNLKNINRHLNLNSSKNEINLINESTSHNNQSKNNHYHRHHRNSFLKEFDLEYNITKSGDNDNNKDQLNDSSTLTNYTNNNCSNNNYPPVLREAINAALLKTPKENINSRLNNLSARRKPYSPTLFDNERYNLRSKSRTPDLS